MGILDKLPTFVTVGALVMIFVCLKRHARSARLQLWTVGWTLVFTHFLAELLGPADGHTNSLLSAIDAGSLQAAAIAFLASVSSVVEDRAKRIMLLVTLGTPAVMFAILQSYDVQNSWAFVLCLATCFGAGVAFFLWANRKLSPYLVIASLLCLSVGTWAMRAAVRGSFDEGSTAMLGLGFGLPGVFICRNYWRRSPAIVTIAGGFLCWGAVFPIGLLLDRAAPHLNVSAAIWNTPKLFVALGMILAIVEEKSQSITGMQRKALDLNRQLERFSAITSRLLGGARVDEMCNEIAAAITEVSNFRGAAIQLEAADHTWRVAGSSGMSESWLAKLQCRAKQLITGSIHDICSEARRVGRNSFLLPDHSAGNSASGWNPGDQMLIPLRSARGADLGCITLVDPRREAAVNASELARIELLAADLAVAIELKSLHRQLVRSEKLAALGQLVAGVAHELNNPLTAVMGYGELVGDEVSSPSAREHSIKMVSEARRMKKIVDNLLRFSRQSPVDKLSVQASGVVQEVLALREYYMRTRNVQVDLDVKPNLWLAIDEDEIKQILLNLLNNSIDAMETTPGRKRIGIRAYQTNSRAVIEVEDTGTGFTHLNRALDPFYTTKPVGKGTGLGLSICYGIVKDHGGEVRLENLEPNGARVTIELPIAEAERPAPALAAAVGAPA